MKKLALLSCILLLVHNEMGAQRILPPNGLDMSGFDDDPEAINNLINKKFKKSQQSLKEQDRLLKKAIDDLNKEKELLERTNSEIQKLEDNTRKAELAKEALKKEEEALKKEEEALRNEEALKKKLQAEYKQKEKPQKPPKKMTPKEELLLKRIIAFINVVSRDLEIDNPCTLVSYVSLANIFNIPLPFFKLYLSGVERIDQEFFNLIKIPKNTSLERKGVAVLSAINLQENSSKALTLANQLFGSPLTSKMQALFTVGVRRGGISYINKLRMTEEKSYISYKIAYDYCNMKMSTQSLT